MMRINPRIDSLEVYDILRPMLSTLNIPDHPFCQFTREVLTEDSIRHHLSALQQHLGLNLNALLFCCWFATSGQKRLTRKELRDIVETIEPWRERIINPLIKMHKTTQGFQRHQSLANAILKKERLANHIEQLMLTEKMIRPYYKRSERQKFTDVCNNITTYCKEMRINMNQEDTATIKKLVLFIFPGINPDNVKERLSNKSRQPTYQQPKIDELL